MSVFGWLGGGSARHDGRSQDVFWKLLASDRQIGRYLIKRAEFLLGREKIACELLAVHSGEVASNVTGKEDILLCSVSRRMLRSNV